jgi:hypothetical protein
LTTDAVDRLAKALRDIIAEVVREAIQELPPPPAAPAPPKPTPTRMPFRPGNPEYDAAVNDPEVKASWEEHHPDDPFPPPPDRRLIPLAEARVVLGGIQHHDDVRTDQ